MVLVWQITKTNPARCRCFLALLPIQDRYGRLDAEQRIKVHNQGKPNHIN